MTSKEFDDLADLLQGEYAKRVKDEGASFTLRQMAKEIGGDMSEETLRRLMNKKIKKRGLDVRTLRALVRKYGRVIHDTLDIAAE